MKKTEVLVIDDEPQIRKLLGITLQANDYRVSEAGTAREGLSIARNMLPDIILLDLGLPDESGHEVLKKLREYYTRPVIILSVQSGEEDIVKALDNGADDYLVKPFRTGELLARIRSSLRAYGPDTMKYGDKDGSLEMDLQFRILKREGVVIKLTTTEFDLLALFMKHEGRVLTHRYLLREIWGPAYVDQTQYLRVFVAQLRKKVEPEPNHPEYILTESGVGYRFVLEERMPA